MATAGAFRALAATPGRITPQPQSFAASTASVRQQRLELRGSGKDAVDGALPASLAAAVMPSDKNGVKRRPRSAIDVCGKHGIEDLPSAGQSNTTRFIHVVTA